MFEFKFIFRIEVEIGSYKERKNISAPDIKVNIFLNILPVITNSFIISLFITPPEPDDLLIYVIGYVSVVIVLEVIVNLVIYAVLYESKWRIELSYSVILVISVIVF